MHTFFIAPTGFGVGLTSVSLGLVRALDNVGLRVAFCKPIAQQHSTDSGPERSTLLIHRVMGLTPPNPITLEHVEDLLGDNKRGILMEEIIGLLEESAGDADVIIVEGLVPTRQTPYVTRLNLDIAKTLGAEVILVSASNQDPLDTIEDKLEIVSEAFGGVSKKRVLGYIINKMSPEDAKQFAPTTPDAIVKLNKFRNKPFEPIGYIPWDSALSSPRTKDVAQLLGARVLNEGEIASRRVTRPVLCARTAANITHHLKPGALVITPGDRDDIIMATALAALNGVPLAGLLLTNGILPCDTIVELCAKALHGSGLPVMLTNTNSYTTATTLDRMNNEVPVDDQERIAQVMDSVAACINVEFLKERCGRTNEPRLSPPAFRYQLVQKSRQANRRIVLPEGTEPRTIQAAAICHQRGIANCILLGDPEKIQRIAKANGINLPSDLIVINPDQVRSRYVAPMVELRKHKGLNAPMAEAQLEDTVVLGTMMLALNEVDGLVSGAVHTTANTIRPAFQLIKNQPGANIVSSIFFMLLPEQVLVYGDCAVNPDPTAEELADIAIQSADSAAAFGISPRVAMISYSTGTSGQGVDVDKVRKATEIAQEKRPDLIIDGPLQYDAAAIESVASKKAPDSPVAGRATVFIFPDLNTGNTTYKAVQRSADVISIGPMMQGLRKPVNDLSRGALVDDIVYTIALTAIQSEQSTL